jgi:HTH-type transcriptional regulator/antitoxin HipB
MMSSIVDFEKEDRCMIIRTPVDLGALIKDRRKKLGLDQRAVAKKAGTSRQWVVAVEQGKPRAAIGLILRTLQALDIALVASEGKVDDAGTVDINRIISSLRKPKK